LENITKWLLKVSGTDTTRKTYEVRIKAFGEYLKEHCGIDIETLKESYREARYTSEIERQKFLDKLQDAIEDYACFIKTQKRTPIHEANLLAIAVSYIKKGCGIKDIEVTFPRMFTIFHNRDITKEEIIKILEHATIRDRAFFLMMAESGLRPSTLLNLRYKHIKQDYEKSTVPMKIELPSELLKDRISDRWTFIGEDGFRVLKEYLSTRKSIDENELLFIAERPSKLKGELVAETSFSNKFSRIVQKLGIDKPLGQGKPKSIRLYVLRKFFFNNMKCDSAYRNFWFCHSSVDDHYISQDQQRHREEYLKGYKFLRIYQPGDVDVRLEALTNELKATREQLISKDRVIEEMRKDSEATKTTLKQLEPLLNFTKSLDEKDLKTFFKAISDDDYIQVKPKHGKVETFIEIGEDGDEFLNEVMKEKGFKSKEEAFHYLMRKVLLKEAEKEKENKKP